MTERLDSETRSRTSRWPRRCPHWATQQPSGGAAGGQAVVFAGRTAARHASSLGSPQPVLHPPCHLRRRCVSACCPAPSSCAHEAAIYDGSLLMRDVHGDPLSPPHRYPLYHEVLVLLTCCGVYGHQLAIVPEGHHSWCVGHLMGEVAVLTERSKQTDEAGCPRTPCAPLLGRGCRGRGLATHLSAGTANTIAALTNSWPQPKPACD